MSHFPTDNFIQDNLYSTETVQQLDAAAIKSMDGHAIRLMKRAGKAAFDEMLAVFGRPTLITVFCGSGNNAGDGYVLAALAAQRRIPVQIVELGDIKKFSPETKQARDFSLQAKVPTIPFDVSVEVDQGVIVDALLGIGCDGRLREPYNKAVTVINDASLPVLAIDIPTGLNADTGAVIDIAVKADITVTFVGAKKGQFTGRGPALCGEIIYDSLDICDSLFENFRPDAQLMDLDNLMESFPQVEADVYKSQRGHCMIIGGDQGYGGAVAMAAESALRVGSGLTSVATQPQHITAVLARCPEVMACAVISGQQLEPWLHRPSTLVIGPGLGRSAWSEQLLQKAVAAGLPMVLDADALNILAQGVVVPAGKDYQWVLTPHAAEAARLLDVTVEEIQADRFAAVRQIQQKYNAVVLLKGSGTLIAGQDSVIKVCPYGNSAMATAGTGDLLSGIIGGLIAQGMSLQMATELGCCLHSAAADMAVDALGSRGISATDLLPYIRQLLNGEGL
jgi:NAD(P)H-hydrate epimerase